MNNILEILKYTLPSIVVLIAAYSTIRMFMSNEEKKRKFELNMNMSDTIIPLRLQAYERLILLLERISPDSLIMRVKSGSLNCRQLQNELINSIRTEFEHNIAQQTYISIEAWEKIKIARAELIKLINMSAVEIRPEASSILLSKRIIENAIEKGKSPTTDAIVFLKKEVKELF